MTLFPTVSRPATGGRISSAAGRYGAPVIVGIAITAVFVGYVLRETLGAAEIFADRAADPVTSVRCATVLPTTTDSELYTANSVAAPRPPPSSDISYLTRQTASARLYTNEGHSLDAYRALDPQLLAPGTYAMQAWLWTHQHPTDCSQARFMVFHDFASGIGSQVSPRQWQTRSVRPIHNEVSPCTANMSSLNFLVTPTCCFCLWCCCCCYCAVQIHVMTHHALCAFREGRVMLWGRRIGIQYTDEKTCGRGVESWLCHLRPPSSCTLEQASMTKGRGRGRGRFECTNHRPWLMHPHRCAG